MSTTTTKGQAEHLTTLFGKARRAFLGGGYWSVGQLDKLPLAWLLLRVCRLWGAFWTCRFIIYNDYLLGPGSCIRNEWPKVLIRKGEEAF
jgi:hypothetical protein